VVITKAGKELFEDVIKWTELKVADIIPQKQAKKVEQARTLLESIA